MPPGAVGAVVAARRNRMNGGGMNYRPTPISAAEQARMEASWKEYEHRVRLNKIIRKYDKNKSKKLERDQLIKLLTDLDTSTPKGTEPTDDEVTFLLKSADTTGDGAIAADELECALASWMTFIEKRSEWDAKMEQYDKSKTGVLSKDEVREYLKDLNGGKDVTEEELDMVFKEADVTENEQIGKMELAKATAIWYGYVERNKSSCCTIS